VTGLFLWRSGRAVDCTGLENQRLERVRGFESHLLRQKCCKNVTKILVDKGERLIYNVHILMKTVGSTGVRRDLISPGDRSDGLERKGSNPLPTTMFQKSSLSRR
jgi:hypothetical protein